MVGRYPFIEPSRCTSREQGEAQLQAILETGITEFVSLQAEVPPQADMPVRGVKGFMPYKATADLMAAGADSCCMSGDSRHVHNSYIFEMFDLEISPNNKCTSFTPPLPFSSHSNPLLLLVNYYNLRPLATGKLTASSNCLLLATSTNDWHTACVPLTSEAFCVGRSGPPPSEIVEGLRNPYLDQYVPPRRKAASEGYRNYKPLRPSFASFPITDLSVPAEADIHRILADVVSRLKSGVLRCPC
jgi:hypothetical protein